MVTDSATKCKTPSFSHRVRERAQLVGGWLCVGIDPQIDRLPAGVKRDVWGARDFCNTIIEATLPYATAYKFNFAFFEVLQEEGWEILYDTRNAVPDDVPIIADAKRGDIGNTSAAYASTVFDSLEFDAVTVSPYLGWDALEPFGAYPGKCLFVLCRTSNPGSGTIQELPVGDHPLYVEVARQALTQKMEAEIGLVVGATHPDALRTIRALNENVLFLVPGVGAQGATAADAVSLAANARGENALIAASREIMYASSNADFPEAAAAAAERLARETVRASGSR